MDDLEKTLIPQIIRILTETTNYINIKITKWIYMNVTSIQFSKSFHKRLRCK